MLYPIIFKKTSTGATQQWQQEIDDKNPTRFRSISGQVGGKLVTSDWSQCETTNEGRANERDPAAQAIFEVEANYKKKLDREYHKSINDIEEPKIFEVMLAKDYNDHKHKLRYSEGIFCQPKLDGMRCVAKADGLFSRAGKPIKGVPHIERALAPLFEADPDLILDGELYNHEYKDDFNSLMSAAKKAKPNLEQLLVAQDVIQYHIYDLPSSPEVFSERIVELVKLIGGLRESALNNDEGKEHGSFKSLHIVLTEQIFDQQKLDKAYESYLNLGYEGQMVRKNIAYEQKRTDGLLKRKESITKEFILDDIEGGLGNWSGKAKSATLLLDDGTNRKFKASICGTMEFCAEVLENKEAYKGKPTTVTFFALTPDGIPRFGRCKEFDRIDI